MVCFFVKKKQQMLSSKIYLISLQSSHQLGRFPREHWAQNQFNASFLPSPVTILLVLRGHCYSLLVF